MSKETPTDAVELTILMPCLNEAETLAACIRKAQQFLSASGVLGEVLVADNGSTDGSVQVAEREGARVVSVVQRGYGAALLGGVEAARGRYVVMGDADDSYDFSALAPFLVTLREGADLVVGNRFTGGIGSGAMPPLHRYLGNPVLSGLGRLLFRIPIGDFHCGLRAFHRERLLSLNLRTTGMEFASEMVVRAALAGHRIAEVPTGLKKDGRSRPPHLRTWRDGWRHLSFLLIHSPQWLFLYPGLALLVAGIVGAFGLLPGPVSAGGIEFDIHTFTVACMAALVGVQAVSLWLVASKFATRYGLLPPSRRLSGVFSALTLDRALVAAAILLVSGLTGVGWCTVQWASTGFGGLEYSALLRVLVMSLAAIAMSIQLGLTGFLSAIIDIPSR